MVAVTIKFAAKTRRLDNKIRPVNKEQGRYLLDEEGESEEEENE